MSPLLKLFYSVVHAFTLPWILYRFAAAGGLKTLPERFGFLPGATLTESVWLHASSVGEVTLLGPLIERFEASHPELAIVISAYTQTGLATARSRYPQHRSFAFPFDFAFAVRRCLRRLHPKLVVVAESEFWPQFLTVLAQQRIPVAIVNAKMSEKSFRLHSRTRFVAEALRTVAAIAVQSNEHASRLRRLRVDAERIVVTGNMKYDLVAAPQAPAAAERGRLGYGVGDVVVIGGSLHEGEDESLLRAGAVLRDGGVETRLIIVPRYPRDVPRVIGNVAALGYSHLCKSALDRNGRAPLAKNHVLIVDTLGELRDLYRIADIAFVGGSLFFRGTNKGGHNLMEPAICGVPVVFGPYNFSFRETATDLVAADGGIEVASTEALGEALGELARDSERRRAMGERARKLVLARQGASARNFALLERVLAGGQH